ncbi:MAG: acyltransferase domain-containing protein, partial [Candidatus Electrothrix sp. AUS4]|nr:acyltransferase domain-containing protein [Candidatus Electrothrix sp. AUS4]
IRRHQLSCDPGECRSSCTSTGACADEKKLLASSQDTELLVLTAQDKTSLIEQARMTARMVNGAAQCELIDLAASLALQVNPQFPWRAAIVASSPEGLIQQLERLQQILLNTSPQQGSVHAEPRQDIWLCNMISPARIGFLLPGQGSQQLNMARILTERHNWAKSLLEQALDWLEKGWGKQIRTAMFRTLDRAKDDQEINVWHKELTRTEIAQPAICLASLLWGEWLKRLGIRPVAVGGHSLGELTALYLACALDEQSFIKTAGLRGQLMAAASDTPGAMASLACTRKEAEDVLTSAQGYAVVANINAPRQIIISGEQEAVHSAVQLAEERGVTARLLPVSNAFHSKLVQQAAERLRYEVSLPKTCGRLSVDLRSCIAGAEIGPETSLNEHLADIVVSQVDFVSLAQSLARGCDLLLEVGPGHVLSHLTATITGESDAVCLPVESRAGCDRDWNTAVAAAFVHGADINWSVFYEDRLVRPFTPASERLFIHSPLEKSLLSPERPLTAKDPGTTSLTYSELASITNLEPEALSAYLKERGDFIGSVIQADLQSLTRLRHLSEQVSAPVSS